jgi:hypothetical protein
MTTSRADDKSRPTIGARLERARLEQREHKLALAVELLRNRAGAADAGQSTRTGLHRAVKDFADELHAIRTRLNDTREP